jgi:hypothetical protein
MAFGAKQIFPVDLNPRRAVGVNIPFSGEVAFIPNYLTKDAIKNNLINFFSYKPRRTSCKSVIWGWIKTVYIYPNRTK